jgi:hypothetical protein
VHFPIETHFRKTAGCASGDSFDLPFSQEIIFDAFGLSAPHVNRMLSEFENQGSIGTQIIPSGSWTESQLKFWLI